MLPDRYYVADVPEGPRPRRLYFYASTEGLNGPEYGYTEDDSWIDSAYEFAVHTVRQRLLVQPHGFEAVAGADVTVSAPREIGPDELVRHDPGVNVHVLNAINLAKREIGESTHPIKVTWFWQTTGETTDEAAVYLKLSADTEPRLRGFTVQEIRNETLMKELIRGLYQDLLERRSRELIINLLRGKVGAGKD